jgi:HlyD family secretion protein
MAAPRLLPAGGCVAEPCGAAPGGYTTRQAKPHRGRDAPCAGRSIVTFTDPGPRRPCIPVGLVAVVLLLAGCRDEGDTLQLVGTVERTLVELSAATSEVIVAMPVERGQRVRPGEVVVQLDATIAAADLAQAEAAVDGARTREAVSKRDLARATDLGRRKVLAPDELEHAQLEWEEAAAALRESEARLTMARKRLADCVIASPVNGVVDQLPYDLGERVPAGAVVAVILQDETPWVRVWVPERAIARLAAGAAAEVAIDGFAAPFAGRVVDISREPEFTPHYALTERERVHLVYEARVLIADAPAELRPGAPATVAIRLGAAAGAGG